MRALVGLGTLLLPTMLGGCIAAVALAPVAASSTAIVRSRTQAKRDARAETPPPQQPRPAEGVTIVPGMTALPRPDGTTAPPSGVPVASAARGAVPAGMQFLYGSGEAAAISAQAYQALTRYLTDRVTYGRKEARQVVLADGATLNAPRFEPCGPKPKAVVLDIDETALLNLGYEADEARRGTGYDEGRWSRWEQTGADKVVAVPGANAAQTEAALDHAGLGPAKHGTTLWLKGDDGGGSGKDDRRWAIASGYCVVALVGDQLGDFSDLFNASGLTPSTRRALAGSPELAALWGNGWFVLPNPVYGTALKGGADDIFPPDTRWTDPAQEK